MPLWDRRGRSAFPLDDSASEHHQTKLDRSGRDNRNPSPGRNRQYDGQHNKQKRH